MQIFRVKAANGITVLIEARNQHQAELRAQSPLIVREFSRLVQQSLSQIIDVEPLRGPQHLVKQLVLDDEFFNKQ